MQFSSGILFSAGAIAILSVFGGASATETAGSVNDIAARQAKAEALAEVTEACDTGAAIPLDPRTKGVAIQYYELFPADFNMEKLKVLQAKCQQAMLGAPKDKHPLLEWLRVSIALDDPGVAWMLPQLRAMAEEGNAEAEYLIYQLYRKTTYKTEADALGVSRAEGLAALQSAAEKGHFGALSDLLQQYQQGPLFRRDVNKAMEIANRIENLPPQGRMPSEREISSWQNIPAFIAELTLAHDGFSSTAQKLAFSALGKATHAGTDGASSTVLAYIRAVRLGLGTSKDPVKARQMLEARARQDIYAVPVLADMMAKGEGGPVDGKRAIAMLSDDRLKYAPAAKIVLAGLLLDGKVVGRQPEKATQLLWESHDIDAYIRLPGLLVDYHPYLEGSTVLMEVLGQAAEVDEPGAAIALARLKLSDNSDFHDEEGARTLLKPLVDKGDRQALWLYAGSQYADLDSTSTAPSRRTDGLSDDDLKTLIVNGTKRSEADAFLLYAKFLRRGVLYPQDDHKATTMLINAANLGSVEAMVRLGDAYSDGIGTPKNARERLHAWRMAASLGSIVARKKIADAFTFDSFDKLITLREGITEKIALYNDGIGRMGLGMLGDSAASIVFSGLFMGRAADAGTDALAGAVMDAFREAPEGLDDANLVSIGKALPDEIRAAIEKRLAKEGFYRGDPQGYFGPDARKALADWVDANGPLQIETADTATASKDQAATSSNRLNSDVLNRVRDRVFKQSMAARTDRQKLAALKDLDTLARYGDIASRWALLRNYHQAKVVRKSVTPAEITRYGLDVLVSHPEGADKAEFEFIFDLTQIYQDGQSDAIGKAVLSATRDDPRLQDPLTLGSVLQQFNFAPGACDSVLDAARKAGIKGLGEEGCDEDSRTALLAYAKTAGVSGVHQAARNAAIGEILALDGMAK